MLPHNGFYLISHRLQNEKKKKNVTKSGTKEYLKEKARTDFMIKLEEKYSK